MTWRIIKNDTKMNFYTGIASIALFNAIQILLKTYCPNITYWQGVKRTSTKIVKRVRGYHKLKNLSLRDEFLMTLMRLRLNLSNEDQADRFGISTGLCSQTFTTWIRIISQVLGNALIVWLPKESIRSNLLACFVLQNYTNCA